MNKKRWICLTALLPFLLLAAMYEILPLAMVIVNSFRSDSTGALTFQNYQTVFSKLLYTKAIENSIRISLIMLLCRRRKRSFVCRTRYSICIRSLTS